MYRTDMKSQTEGRGFVSDNFPAAKAGDALRIYDRAKQYYDAGQIPPESHYSFAWIIYYAMHQSPTSAILERKKMLSAYLSLDVRKPHKLHSMILLEALRLRRNALDRKFTDKSGNPPDFSLVKFMDLWDLANLRPGDWKRHTFEEKELGSTVDKLITLYVNELEANRQPPSEGFRQVMDHAFEQYPSSATLLGQKAILLKLEGRPEEARETYRRAIITAPKKFYLWGKMAELVDPALEPRLYVGLLAHGLAIHGQDEFKGRIRLKLAKFFAGHDRPAEALWELETYRRLYEQKGWGLSKIYSETRNSLPEGTVPANPSPIYRRLIPRAEEEIFSCIAEEEMTKTYHRPAEADKNPKYGKPSVAWRVTDLRGQNYWLQPERFRLVQDLPLGTVLLVRIFNGHPVSVRPK